MHQYWSWRSKNIVILIKTNYNNKVHNSHERITLLKLTLTSDIIISNRPESSPKKKLNKINLIRIKMALWVLGVEKSTAFDRLDNKIRLRLFGSPLTSKDYCHFHWPQFDIACVIVLVLLFFLDPHFGFHYMKLYVWKVIAFKRQLDEYRF